jgi:hypothetical protein
MNAKQNQLVDSILEVMTSRSISVAKGAREAVLHSPETCRFLSKSAAETYHACGRSNAWQCRLFEKLSHELEWSKEMAEQFAAPVLRAIDSVQIPKKAGMLATVPAGLAGRAAAMSPGTYKLLLGLGVGAGLAGGGLTWKAKREISEDEEDVAALQAKVDYYDKVTRELDEQMQRAQRSRPISMRGSY